VTPADAGFSLIEVIISVVIFSAVILGLAGLAFHVARRSTRATHQAHVMSGLQGRVDRAASVPFDSLPALVGCDTTASGAVRIYGCTTIVSSTPRLADLAIVVTTNVPGNRPDTIRLTRSKVRTPIPIR
jgi:prepilin-type N-terminal cleavage/methylation domain-containing protein